MEAALKSCKDRLEHLENAPSHHCGKRQRQRSIELEKVKIAALRPVTREQVERVWRGEWEPGNPICPICGKDKFDGLDADIWADWMPNFCPHCGAPMTDKAVDMVMERLDVMKDGNSVKR